MQWPEMRWRRCVRFGQHSKPRDALRIVSWKREGLGITAHEHWSTAGVRLVPASVSRGGGFHRIVKRRMASSQWSGNGHSYCRRRQCPQPSLAALLRSKQSGRECTLQILCREWVTADRSRSNSGRVLARLGHHRYGVHFGESCRQDFGPRDGEGISESGFSTGL